MSEERLSHYINGEQVNGKSGRFAPIYNPATGEVEKEAPLAGREEMKRAIGAAQAAFASWSKTPAAKRAAVMYRFRELILSHLPELMELVSREHGKTLADAKGAILRGVEVVEFCTGMPTHLTSMYSQEVAREVDTYNLRQPLGVCAGITPFNFPAMVPMWMFPVAIGCGNTFVLKPSEKDPSASLRLAELFKAAGLPDGVFNVVISDKVGVDALLEDERVKAVSFVGSTAVAEYVYQKGSAHNKRVQALGGAKNHLVVMPDADLERVTQALLGSVYGSAGERCMAISVAVVVGEKTAEEVLARLTPRVRALKVGAYDTAGVEMGPIISKENLDRIRGYIAAGVKEGAELVLDGREVKVAGAAKGFFIGGSIFDKVNSQMSIYQAEIFGPVLCVVRVKHYEAALALVNEHEYGNGVAIFTRDGDTARHFSTHCEIGMVGINVPIPVPVAYHSFGGWKRSLFGANAVHGLEGVRFYTRLKTVTSRWPSGVKEGAEFNFKAGSEA